MLKISIATIVTVLFSGCVMVPDGNNLYEQRRFHSYDNEHLQEPVYIQRNYGYNYYEISRNKDPRYESEHNKMYMDRLQRDHEERQFEGNRNGEKDHHQDHHPDDKPKEIHEDKQHVEKPQSMSSTENPNKRKRGSGMGD